MGAGRQKGDRRGGEPKKKRQQPRYKRHVDPVLSGDRGGAQPLYPPPDGGEAVGETEVVCRGLAAGGVEMDRGEWQPALAVSLGHLQFRPGWLEGEDTCGLEQTSILQPPSRDAVFQHYYSQLIYVVKLRKKPSSSRTRASCSPRCSGYSFNVYASTSWWENLDLSSPSSANESCVRVGWGSPGTRPQAPCPASGISLETFFSLSSQSAGHPSRPLETTLQKTRTPQLTQTQKSQIKLVRGPRSSGTRPISTSAVRPPPPGGTTPCTGPSAGHETLAFPSLSPRTQPPKPAETSACPVPAVGGRGPPGPGVSGSRGLGVSGWSRPAEDALLPWMQVDLPASRQPHRVTELLLG
ncbi:hypothetical protein AB1E18_005229 [Capra hircus]